MKAVQIIGGKTKELPMILDDRISKISAAISGDTLVACTGYLYSHTFIYVFERDRGGAGNWGEVKTLDVVGCEGDKALDIDGDTMMVDSWYIFERDEGGTDNWGTITNIHAVFPLEHSFGYSIDLFGDILIMGTDHDSSTSSRPANSAYIFERDEGGTDNWGVLREIWASNEEQREDFAHSVAGSGNTIAIGVPGNSNSGFSRSGAIFLYEHTLSTADNDNDGTLAGDDPHDGDPCYPDDSVSNCDRVIDADGDGLTAPRGDQDDNDPCVPFDDVPACTGTTSLNNIRWYTNNWKEIRNLLVSNWGKELSLR